MQIMGAEFRRQQQEDLAAVISLHVLHAAGATRKDKSPLTIEDILGRERVRLVPPPEVSEAEREEQAAIEAEVAARNERTRWQLYQAQAERAARTGQGPPIQR